MCWAIKAMTARLFLPSRTTFSLLVGRPGAKSKLASIRRAPSRSGRGYEKWPSGELRQGALAVARVCYEKFIDIAGSIGGHR
jgi:hypothetical protein